MTEQHDFLATVPIFSTLEPSELRVVGDLTSEASWEAGEEIYKIADPGGSMFIVTQGVVELYGLVEGFEKLFMTVRPGGVFGLLSMIDLGDRPGNARAVEPTRALVMEHAALEELLRDRPRIGVKVLRGVGATLGERVRALTGQYSEAVAWNLEITALTGLGLERLMTERVLVTVEPVRGEPLRGTLLTFESSAAGHQLMLETTDRQIHLIPYHAIVRISVDRASLRRTEDPSAI